jgi:hypothetical protein
MSTTVPCWATPLPRLWVAVILNLWLVGPRRQIVAINDSAQRPQPVSQMAKSLLGHGCDVSGHRAQVSWDIVHGFVCGW